ncbi:ribonuclease H-like domain-containing protein [Tanacetum coccineum]
MAHMASSDSEVKTCSKTCLKNNETLKKQYDDLRTELNKSQSDLANYKRGLASVEERLLFFKKNEVVFCEKVVVLKRDVSIRDSEINVLRSELEKLKQEKESYQLKIENFENASKSLDLLLGSQIADNSRKGVGFVSYNAVPHPLTGLFLPPTIDLSNSGLEEFQEPKFEGYGPKTSKNGKLQHDDKGFVDSGCSRHMTGKIAYLSDFKQFDGGYVAFGGGAYGGKISGKGTLKTANFKLHLEELPNENQILLYSFDMKNSVPKENLTCLVAKATLDESMLWHRRLGYINFKNINKLVKDNLVRGLPIKHFENDQTYIACLKGKQHKASYKSKVLNLITKPLFMLYMDLFGTTFVSSLNA